MRAGELVAIALASIGRISAAKARKTVQREEETAVSSRKRWCRGPCPGGWKPGNPSKSLRRAEESSKSTCRLRLNSTKPAARPNHIRSSPAAPRKPPQSSATSMLFVMVEFFRGRRWKTGRKSSLTDMAYSSGSSASSTNVPFRPIETGVRLYLRNQGRGSLAFNARRLVNNA